VKIKKTKIKLFDATGTFESILFSKCALSAYNFKFAQPITTPFFQNKRASVWSLFVLEGCVLTLAKLSVSVGAWGDWVA